MTEPPATIPALLARTAHRYPGQQALRMNGEHLSYQDLDMISNQVANTLIAGGVEPGYRVGIYAHKSLHVIAALYGAMKAGAAYVPINPRSPKPRVRQIIDDCGIRHLVSDSRLHRRLGDLRLDLTIGPDAEPPRAVPWPAVQEASAEPPSHGPDPDDLAYILYTSGSTGHPKGIMHSHRSGLAFVEAAADIYGLGPHDRLTNHAPLHFDLSTLDLFAATASASTTVVVPLGHTRLPASLGKLLEEERITVIYSVPFALVQLLHRGGIDHRDLSALRWVLFAGEAFPTKDLRALMHRLPQARFSNIYGPTETNGCTYYHVDEIPEDDSEFIPIGVPFPDTEILIVDDEDRPVDDDEPGELLVRSESQMIGYWGRPDLTSQSTYDRSEDGTDRRYYRTGDMATLDSDGLLRLAGRKDRQIKTRGHRVELDEVEAALLSHERVREAAVYAVPDGQGSKQIEAVARITDSHIEMPVLMRHLREILPDYAMPRSIRLVAEIPRTSTGKIDRRALEIAGDRDSPASS